MTAAAAPTPRPKRAKTDRRAWPHVTPGDLITEATWRATMQERVDTIDERLEEVLEAVTRPPPLERVWHSFAALVANPSKGTVVLAVLLVVVALALIGWSAADVATLSHAVAAPAAP
jgi:hypothetical protein